MSTFPRSLDELDPFKVPEQFERDAAAPTPYKPRDAVERSSLRRLRERQQEKDRFADKRNLSALNAILRHWQDYPRPASDASDEAMIARDGGREVPPEADNSGAVIAGGLITAGTGRLNVQDGGAERVRAGLALAADSLRAMSGRLIGFDLAGATVTGTRDRQDSHDWSKGAFAAWKEREDRRAQFVEWRRFHEGLISVNPAPVLMDYAQRARDRGYPVSDDRGYPVSDIE